jgi:hypothetical protein
VVEPVIEHTPAEDRLSLYPDLPFEDALERLLTVDPRKTDSEEGGDDERPA